MNDEKYCQSCSMPLNEEVYGTEKDGSKSHVYCKFCYQDGSFTYPHLTLEKMIKHLTSRMDKEKFPEEIIEAAIARLPHLKRWENSDITHQ